MTSQATGPGLRTGGLAGLQEGAVVPAHSLEGALRLDELEVLSTGQLEAISAAYDPDHGGGTGSLLETQKVLELLVSEDGREGVAAFLESRPAEVVGR